MPSNTASVRPLCGQNCARWIGKHKRCPRGAVSAKQFADTCGLYLPKE